MKTFLQTSLPALALLGLLGAPPAAAQESSYSLLVRVRDSQTGRQLPAGLQMAAGKTGKRLLTATAAPTGPVLLETGGRPVKLVCRRAGYRPLAARFAPPMGANLPVTFWLDPVRPDPRYAPKSLIAHMPENSGLIYGWVYDAQSGRPLENAYVRLVRSGESSFTNRSGFFQIEFVPPAAGLEDLPPLETCEISAAGHNTVLVQGLLLMRGATQIIQDLKPGFGVRAKDVTPLPLRGPHAQKVHQSAGRATEPPASRGYTMARPSPLPDGSVPLPESIPAASLVGLSPPASIRVGTNCSCTSCSGVDVLSLETYVAEGLDDEWIASWGGQSLRAGSVAYRSYGAWYVNHPLNGSYDICSSTCCQTFNSDAYPSTTNAAHATAGFMLQEGGALFRSEYSAENNNLQGSLSCTNSDLSCGDGYAGSPAAGWPCLSDSVCAGQACYGHGRGECQWGSSRWDAAGKYWNWITNHYYNANGSPAGNRSAFVTSPVAMPSFSPSPAALSPGQTFTIDVTADNNATLAHSEIMIGASLYSSATGYISDPFHDAKVSLDPGANQVSRLFTVPASSSPGTYDLVVALWYDVNGDGAITGTDLPLLVSTDAGAVVIGNPPTVPNGWTVSGPPLTASRADASGTAVTLKWGTCPSAAGYSVYYGNLAGVSSYAFSGAHCGLSTSGEATWTSVPSGNIFFIIDSQDAQGMEGSWGVDSQGRQRGGDTASGLCGSVYKVTGTPCQ